MYEKIWLRGEYSRCVSHMFLTKTRDFRFKSSYGHNNVKTLKN